MLFATGLFADFGIPRSVNFFTLSFSSRALFILSNCFCMVLYCLSDYSFAASLYFLVFAVFLTIFGAKVHSSAFFSYSYSSFVLSVFSS